MKKKKIKPVNKNADFDPELLRMYLMGATNPGFSNKYTYAEDSIDLHIESLHQSKPGIPPQDSLFIQLEKFEHALDKAIAANKLEFRVIHGLGKGKLKEEIYKILKKHPHVRSFTNDYHSKYGFGSTLIILE